VKANQKEKNICHFTNHLVKATTKGKEEVSSMSEMDAVQICPVGCHSAYKTFEENIIIFRVEMIEAKNFLQGTLRQFTEK
jgi:hypothetical protein